MIRLGLISCLGATLALPACIVNHDLGETAEEGGGSGEGSAGETDPDPSATSGQPGTTDPTDTATGEVPGTTDPSATATDGDTDTSTDTDTGEASSCDHDPEYLRWQLDDSGLSALAGIDASFVAILNGDCTVGEMTVSVPEEGDPMATIPLQCSLQGQLDGDASFAGDLSPSLELRGTIDFEEVAQVLGQDVRIKLVLDWWGMGWSGWLVLEHPNTGVQLLDLVHAEYLDPYASTWSRQVGEVFGAPWRANISVGEVDDDCALVLGPCNELSHALQLGIGPDSQLLLHEVQEGTMSNEDLFLLYRASLTTARENPMPTCTDTPLGSYVLSMWMLPQ